MAFRFPILCNPIIATVFIATTTLPSAAQDNAPSKPPLSIFERLAGNTVTGYNTSGVNFTEYHSPDGRIFGFNAGRPAIDACWRTAGPDIVCYYYDRSRNTRRELCWRFEPVGEIGFKIYALGSSTIGAFRLEKGNPHNLTDQGQTWTCDAQMVDGAPSKPTQSILIPATYR